MDLFLFLFQECQLKANDGKFRLRDLLAVPMQRVLKYHLLLKVSDYIHTHTNIYTYLYVLHMCYNIAWQKCSTAML